jgi:hypothetical protein
MTRGHPNERPTVAIYATPAEDSGVILPSSDVVDRLPHHHHSTAASRAPSITPGSILPAVDLVDLSPFTQVYLTILLLPLLTQLESCLLTLTQIANARLDIVPSKND